MVNQVELTPAERAEKDIQNFKENYEYIFLSPMFEIALENSKIKVSKNLQTKMEELEAKSFKLQEEIFSSLKVESKSFGDFYFEIYVLNQKFQSGKMQIERELKQDVETDLKRGFINSDVAKILIHLAVNAAINDGEFVQNRFDKFILDFKENSEKIYQMIQDMLIDFYESNKKTLNLKHGSFLTLMKDLDQYFSLPANEIKFEIFGKEKTLDIVHGLYKFETVPFFKSVATIKNSDLVEMYIVGFSFEEMAEKKSWTINKTIRMFKESAGKIYNKLRRAQFEDIEF